jgi:hypothetical protein
VTVIHRKIGRNSGTYQVKEHRRQLVGSLLCIRPKNATRAILSADHVWVQCCKDRHNKGSNGLVTDLYTIFGQETQVTCTIRINTAFLDQDKGKEDNFFSIKNISSI